MPEKVTRRDFLKLSITAMLGAGASYVVSHGGFKEAFNGAEEAKKKFAEQLAEQRLANKKKLSSLENLPLLTDEEFYDLTEPMAFSSFPLMRKAGKEIAEFWTTDKRPADLPDWLNNPCPLAIVSNDQTNSGLIIEFFTKTNDSLPPTEFIVHHPDGQECKFPYAVSANIGISSYLNSAAYDEKSGRISVPSLFLFKQWVQLGVILSGASDYLFHHVKKGYSFKNTDGSPLNEKQIASASASLFFAKQRKAGAFYNFYKSLPLFLTAIGLKKMDENNQLPKEDIFLTPFFLAYRIGYKHGIIEKIQAFNQRWIKSGRVTAPLGITDLLAANENIWQASIELQRQLKTKSNSFGSMAL